MLTSAIARRVGLAGGLACVGAFLAPAVAAAASIVGVSDQHASTFSDQRFRALGVAHARLIVPWDVALTDPDHVTVWLRAARGAGQTPLVSFERASSERCPDSPCRAPGRGEFRDAFEVFRARWPDVREFTAWNEPNHPKQPVVSTPELAAAYHDTLRHACPSCTVIAGDFVDSASMKGYFTSYRAALRQPVLAWGLHNYGDVTYERPSVTEWLLRAVDEPLWLTETGGIVVLRARSGQELLAYDEHRADVAMRRLITLLAAYPTRIARTYVYHWRSQPALAFDAGLLRDDGTERPALATLRDYLARRPDASGRPAGRADREARRPSGSSPLGASRVLSPQSTSGNSRHRLSVGLPRVVRGGWRVPVRCPRRDCRARVTLVSERQIVGTRAFAVRGRGWHRVTVRQRASHEPGQKLTAYLVLRRPRIVVMREWFRG